MSTTSWVLGILGTTLALAACGPEARKSEPLTGPLELSEQARLGREHFMRHCNECHPGGEAGLGPALNSKLLHAAEIRAQVRNGFGEMPAFDDARLPDQDLDAIIAFLEALREHGE